MTMAEMLTKRSVDSLISEDRDGGIALVHARGQLRYPELVAAADRCAAALAEAGAGPGALVPVLLPRGPELIAVLIGIGRLGAGYAALDPRWPDERIRQLCSMLRPPVVVTGEPSRAGQPTWNPAGLLSPGAATHPPARVQVPGDAVGCVFFTSGSTGTPKAIPATRRAITGLLRPGAMPLRLGRSTVMTVAAPAPWDAFALELWGPLRNGGTCLLVEGDYLSPAELRENVAKHGQNTVWLTSSLFSLFVEEDIGAFDGITQVVTGGERLSPGHAKEFLLAHPGARLFNGYGPAENCVFATMHPVTADDCGLAAGIPIGKPVGDTEVLILDGERACGPGELGEICLAGPRLAPGYLGDEELTRRVFVTLGRGGRPTRIYRTGDLGWQDETGRYHFHGRADRQVKVRGHRVEPAEIERQVAAHPAIARCVVVPAAGPGGTVTELVACYQARSDVSGADLCGFLQRRLPGYLVPERWLPVDRIPMLPNGKADLDEIRARAGQAQQAEQAERVVLAERPSGQHRTDTDPVLDDPVLDDPVLDDPVLDDPVLDALRGLVGESTGLGAMPPDASLVAAGANSLQLIRLCLRAARRWRVRVEPAEFFGRPTLGHLATLVRRAAQPQPTQSRPAQPQQAQPRLEREDGLRSGHPLNAVASAFLLTEAVDPANRHAWHCALVWRIDGPVDEGTLRHAVECVHRRHPALHARYDTTPPFRSAWTEPPTSPEFTVLAGQDADEAYARLDRVLHAPFRLDRGPAWRAALARVGGADVAMLGVCVHHVAFDGWSERVLARDLAAAYAGQLSGAPTLGRWYAEPLPWPLDDPAAGPDTERQRRMLAAELDGTPALVFPAPPAGLVAGPWSAAGTWSAAGIGLAADAWSAADSGAGAGAGPDGPTGVIVRTLDAGQARDCHALAREHATTPFVVGLAGYAAAAAKLTGLTDFPVTAPVAQRGADTEDAVGCLLNLLCLRLRLPDASGDPLAAIAAATRAARCGLRTQDVPFPEAVGLLRPPVVPHLFVLQHNRAPVLELPGCRASLRRPVQHYAGFEFQVELRLPAEDQGEVVVTYRRAAVDDTFASSFTDAFTAFIHRRGNAGPGGPVKCARLRNAPDHTGPP
jgi:amino acid adenylation domain-containing protein